MANFEDELDIWGSDLSEGARLYEGIKKGLFGKKPKAEPIPRGRGSVSGDYGEMYDLIGSDSDTDKAISKYDNNITTDRMANAAGMKNYRLGHEAMSTDDMNKFNAHYQSVFGGDDKTAPQFSIRPYQDFMNEHSEPGKGFRLPNNQYLSSEDIGNLSHTTIHPEDFKTMAGSFGMGHIYDDMRKKSMVTNGSTSEHPENHNGSSFIDNDYGNKRYIGSN